MYETLVGEAAWNRLPAGLRAIHSPGRARGRVRVRRGSGFAARLLGWICRFPAETDDVEVELCVSETGRGLRWDRRFGTVRMRSEQHVAGGRLRESFGPLVCDLEVGASNERLDFVVRRVSLVVGRWHARLPSSLAPRIGGRAEACGTGARIEIEVWLPLAGLVLAYAGFVEAAGGAP
jgi:uncharacterized protein DUF4166